MNPLTRHALLDVLYAPCMKRLAPWAGVLALSLIFLLAFIAYPVIRSTFDFEASYNEGWNAYHQRDAIAGTLYPDSLGYVFTNYTPLSFYLIGFLSQHGDPILAGRIVSILAFFILVAAIGFSARNLGASRLEALLASILSIGIIGSLHSDHIGINDPQMLGTTVQMVGLLVWSYGPSRLPQNVAALLLFLVSGLIKQTVFAIPIAIAAELLLRDRGVGIRFCTIAVAMVIIVLCALYGIFDGAIFPQLTAPRIYSLHAASTKTIGYLTANAACLPLMLIFLGRYLSMGANRFVLIYLLVALAEGALLSGGAGVDSNLFIDVGIGLCLGAASILRCLRVELRAGTGIIAGFILLCLYGPVLRVPYAIERLRDGLAGELRADEATFRDDVAFMRERPGPALCHSPMLCFRAGRPFVFDPFNATQAIRLNRVDAAPLLAAMAGGKFAVIQLSTSREAHALGPPMHGGADVALQFEQVLRQRYHEARWGRRRVFYLPNEN